MNKKYKNIVVIGGGTGTFMVLSGLKKYPVNLSAIVTMADDGGSSGVLRDEYGVLPPGDIRRALVVLSGADKSLRDLFTYRFKKGGFAGHSFGNIFLSALESTTGDFRTAVKKAHEILNVQGEVIPVTLTDTRLFAELENGEIIKGESNIDVPKHNPELKIKKVFLKPRAKGNIDAIKAIGKADLIVIGPGDLYTSIIPNLLVTGIKEAVKKSKAKKVYVVNLMTKWGETNGFNASDFISILESYLGEGILDFIITNKEKPTPSRLTYYKKKDKALFVKPDLKTSKLISLRLLAKGKFIRHSRSKLARTLIRCLK